MLLFKRYKEALLHLLYPHTCCCCGSDLLQREMKLCLQCYADLPRTLFASFQSNPVEQIFFGRIPLQAAHSEFYFTKNEMVQKLLHELKYNGNKYIGSYLGNLTGETLFRSGRFNHVDVILPVPLHPAKEASRGYNQAEIIAEGISEKINAPVMKKNLVKKISTQTQTRKNRIERWENVATSFSLEEPESLYGKKILLVDDVITTGASIEACGNQLLNIEGTSLCVASLAYASK